MTKESDNDWLKRIGLAPETRPAYTLWKFVHQSAVVAETGKSRTIKPSMPWRIRRLELSERKGILTPLSLETELDRERFANNLRAFSRRYFGPRTSTEVVVGRHGEFWCLYEFARPGPREKAKGSPVDSEIRAQHPHGVGGYAVRLSTDGSNLTIAISNIFGIGFLPSNFSVLPLRHLREALFLRHPEPIFGDFHAKSIFELTVPIWLPIFAELSEQFVDEQTSLLNLKSKLEEQKSAQDSAIFADGDKIRIMMPQDEAALAAFELPLAKTQLVRLPVEVLEARERHARYADIDKTILSGKSLKALDTIQNALKRDGMDPFLMRRLALIGLSRQRERLVDFVEKALGIEPNNELFLSYACALCIERGEQSNLLGYLSRLGHALTTTIPGTDRLSTFDEVLPEVLGDAWRNEDPAKAEDCYHRVIAKRGDMPRVLRKLIGLARESNRSDVEAALLSRLAKVERRHLELAKIYLRHAELRQQHQTGQDDALELALKALRLNRNETMAAKLAASILVNKDKAIEAIQLLDGVLRDASSLTIEQRAEIDALVATIWEKSLGRPDLAESRYEQSIQQNKNSLSVLESAEAIYRAKKDLKKLGVVLELKFDAFEAKGSGEGMRRSFDELSALLRGPLGQPKKAYTLYQRLLATVNSAPEEIDNILAWRDVQIDWEDLYARLLATLPSMPRGERRSQFLCRLAEICRSKLGLTPAALRHLVSALEDGWIDPGGFRFVVEQFAAAADWLTLANCYEKRILQVAPSERRDLIREMLALPSGISSERRDELAIAIYLIEQSETRSILQRFQQYQVASDIKGLRHILDLLLKEPHLTPQTKAEWMRSTIAAAAGFDTEDRFTLIDELFRKLLSSGEEQKKTLIEAIDLLKDAKDQSILTHFVVMLLGLGSLPDLPELGVLNLLRGRDLDLALYHRLLSEDAKDDKIAALHARTAAAIYAKKEGQDRNTERMLKRYCTLAPCSEDDLEQLRRLVIASGQWATLAKVLSKQADFEDEPSRKFVLLDRLGQVYWLKIKDYSRARLTYLLAMRLAPEPVRIKILLARIAADAGDAKGERRALADFLLDSDCTNDTLAMTAAVARLIKLKEEAKVIHRLIQPHAESALDGGQAELSLRIAFSLIDNDIASTDIFRIAFRASVLVKNDDKAIYCWWRGMATTSDKARAKAFMVETRQILERENRKDLLSECFREALKQQKVWDQIGPKIRREILVQYGLLLFDTDNNRSKALPVFVEAFRADPDDSRTWMPIYFLLSEFGSHLERLRHLKDIVPRLETDPRPLKSYPITIELLKTELLELEAGVHSLPSPLETEGAGSGDVIFDDDQQQSAKIGLLPKATTEVALVLEDAQNPAQTQARAAGDAIEYGAAIREAKHSPSWANAPETDTAPPNFSLGREHQATQSTKRKDGPKLIPIPSTGLATAEPTKTAPGTFALAQGRNEDLEQDEGQLDLGADELPASIALVPGTSGLELNNKDSILDKLQEHPILVEGPTGSTARGLTPPKDDERILDQSHRLITNVEELMASPLRSTPDASEHANQYGSEGYEQTGEPANSLNFDIELGVHAQPASEAPQESVTPSVNTTGLITDGIDYGPAEAQPVADLAADAFTSTPELGRAGSIEAPRDFDIVLDLDLNSPPSPGNVETDSDDKHAKLLLDDTAPPQVQIEQEGIVQGIKGLDILLGDPVHTNDESEEQALLPVTSEAAPHSNEKSSAVSAEAWVQSSSPGIFANTATGTVQESGLSAIPSPASLPVSDLLQSTGHNLIQPADDKTKTDESAMPQLDEPMTSDDAHYAAGIEQPGDDASDWRAAVVKGDFNADLTGRLMTQAFASEIEKHLAIQTVAIVAGNCEKLSNWHWRVWRRPDEFGYRISMAERFPDELKASVLNSSLLKLVTSMGTILVRAYRERFTKEHIAQKLDIHPDAVARLCKPMPWDQGLLHDIGMPLLMNRIQGRGFKAFNIAGLERQIFYDGSDRSFYIDETWYRKQPRSHLFHRLSGIMWSINWRYFIPVSLHPTKQFMPVMAEVHQILSATAISRFTGMLASKSKVGKILAKADLKEVRAAHEKIGMPTEEQVNQLWDAMRQHIYKVQLAETLDVVGVFEALIDKDLLKPQALRHSQIYELSPFAKSLIEFVTKLKI